MSCSAGIKLERTFESEYFDMQIYKRPFAAHAQCTKQLNSITKRAAKIVLIYIAQLKATQKVT